MQQEESTPSNEEGSPYQPESPVSSGSTVCLLVGAEFTATDGSILDSYATQLKIGDSRCMIIAEESRGVYHFALSGFGENANGCVSILVHHNRSSLPSKSMEKVALSYGCI
jgi:hypothetical protein